jgi:hypothetical protein
MNRQEVFRDEKSATSLILIILVALVARSDDFDDELEAASL